MTVTAATGSTFSKYLGLHESCSTVAEPSCRPFPNDDECREDKDFCALWRTSGFFLSFATIVELATLIAFIVVIKGGKFKREGGWRLISTLLLVDGIVEFAGMGIVTWLFKHDSQFLVPGWSLDYSFYLATTSASVSVVTAVVLAASAYILPPENDYESLEDHLDS
ncbi:hypothetical protein GGR50DRAFT_691347 [Xylaria sp. CBS 124048]|nr:hypothetical protein GGR50DRAFT_691347 [Xylaria sp. CBS 124048]